MYQCKCGKRSEGRDKFGNHYCAECWEKQRLNLLSWVHSESMMHPDELTANNRKSSAAKMKTVLRIVLGLFLIPLIIILVFLRGLFRVVTNLIQNIGDTIVNFLESLVNELD